MARARLNPALTSINGNVDGYVYRHYRGRTVIQRKPVFTQPWSEAQAKTRTTFAGGSAFAAKVKADPELRAFYTQAGKRQKLNYRQMAIRDYFNPPTVDGLETYRYSPAKGGELRVDATDALGVARVRYELRDATGAQLAAGDATLGDVAWSCTLAPAPATAARPFAILITAEDRPGNATSRTFPLG